VTEARIDLHCHTSYSEDREQLQLPHGISVTTPFHPAMSPAEVYDLAIERGMTHVTFTDHDTCLGCLDLLERHPDPCVFIPGEEVTCYAAGVPVHVGVYGLTEADHQEIHRHAERTDRERRCLRWNLPELLSWLDERGLPFDLKHPLWAPNGHAFSREHLIDLLGRFRLVEAVNGTRHRSLNELGVLLARRFGPPQTAFTGGSDSHTDNIGRCHTRTWGASVAEVLSSLREGHCEPFGPSGSHRLLERDTRLVIHSNIGRRAAHAIALVEEQLDELPDLATDLLSIFVTGVVAYGVVQEFARQRALAREVAEWFTDQLERGASNGLALATPDPRRAVHGHLRRD